MGMCYIHVFSVYCLLIKYRCVWSICNWYYSVVNRIGIAIVSFLLSKIVSEIENVVRAALWIYRITSRWIGFPFHILNRFAGLFADAKTMALRKPQAPLLTTVYIVDYTSVLITTQILHDYLLLLLILLLIVHSTKIVLLYLIQP